ncbi:MAG: HDOD domain-containing protein [Sulfuriflexus sp.]|nr:HDOD domain-containing protein [Sulfuriflexus sp.]
MTTEVVDAVSADAAIKAEIMHSKLAELDSLPPMPDVAAKLLKLSRDPDTMPEDIAHVIETDPAIVAQIMQYANSPWYSYKGEISSVEEAIFSVLGMEMVTNMALGMSAGTVFTIPGKGVLGAESLWRHAVYCAALSEALARIMPSRYRIKPGVAYLSGLLHNIGLMVISHCCSAEFIELSEAAEANLNTPISELEHELYGSTHAEIGGSVMQRWNLSDQLIHVITHHHDSDYMGVHKLDVMLVKLVNCALATKGIGDERNTELDTDLLELLSLSEETVLDELNNLLENSSNLDKMIAQMVA